MTYQVVYCNACTGYEISYEGDSLEKAREALKGHAQNKPYPERAAIHTEDEIIEDNGVEEFIYHNC